MKKVMKKVIVTGLAMAVLFGGSAGLSTEASAKAPMKKTSTYQKAQVSQVENVYVIPVVKLGEKVRYGKARPVHAKDQFGTKFANYKTFADYKKIRDSYFTEDLEMAKEYQNILGQNIMPVLNGEYLGDIYKAKVYYGYIAEKDGFGTSFKKFKSLSEYKVLRDRYFQEDLQMAKDYMSQGKNILPILQAEYDAHMALASEYFEAKKWKAIN